MLLFLILLTTEILTIAVLRQHYHHYSGTKHFISLVIHAILSLWVWIFFLAYFYYNSFYDNPRHVWIMMMLAGMVTAIIFPRVLLIILHFSGKMINYKGGGHLRWMTNTGIGIMGAILLIITISTVYGRFNLKTEEVTIKIDGLNDDLDGLRIVQISDLHLNSFYHHKKKLERVMYKVNALNPDLIVNTGDFVTYGWREFESNDTILSKARSKYGNYAILGNHDIGTYQPDFTEADRENNILILNDRIRKSGYHVLNDEYKIVKIGSARIGMIGVLTKGRHPEIVHGDLEKATLGLDSVDLKILMTHDPNHWEKDVSGKTDIKISLSGHTHGMQMGIMTKKFRWSPAKYFFPHWNGLFRTGDQFHYVNRGIGVIAIPFRIWMPPEITVITIRK